MNVRTQFRIGPFMFSGILWLAVAAVFIMCCCCGSLLMAPAS